MVSFQTVLDYLANHGHITTASLELFRSMDDVFRLDMTESIGRGALMAPVEGVKDVLRGMAFPTLIGFSNLTVNCLDYSVEKTEWVCAIEHSGFD